MDNKRYSVPLASHSSGVHPVVHEDFVSRGEYLRKLPSTEYMQSGYSIVQSEPDMVQPYVNPNFSELPKWTVEVQFKEWRHLPRLQKNLMIKEKLMNARTIEEQHLAYRLQKIESHLNKTKNTMDYKSSNKSMS